MTASIQQTLLAAREQLQTSSPSAQADSEILLCKVLSCNRTHLHTWPEQLLSTEQSEHLQSLIKRRLQGEPVAYLIGQRAFWEFDLKVSAHTLIPRPETELLVEQALALIPAQATYNILDLGTGTGAIALAIAHERPSSRVTAVDSSNEALAVAADNINSYSLGNIELMSSHWFSALTDTCYHTIVSNPPYIPANDPHLREGDVAYEPSSALVSGQDGLDDIRHIIEHASRHLHPGGHLLIEHGYDQAEPVKDLFLLHGFDEIQQHQDLGEHLRITQGRHKV